MAESTHQSTPLDLTPDNSAKIALANAHLPRISIQFCTQCRWMLRAAYFAQELLSTFSTDLGEVALVPKTGGVFTVTIWHGAVHDGEMKTQEVILWDRKRDGGFPDVKALKSLVRNVIAPNKDLGHTDRALNKERGAQEVKKEEKGESQDKASCEDCQ
ncbi:Selenoprotein, Rdx type [Penicillium digitatum]|uniref:Selenoprotein domain-containing protein n=3 Tax=Penicillium digitatum TaxID=36651 RepID=K9FQJ0_PEND2|nr:hypothetical protein PDIP_19800 [Penicillium digitatum Pd1]EKV11419.1 hypothetical protein PDIG_50560 [Penicillium digitatum PHI26]EKV20094.1 hypothetical protein PDIP_19800 [Penicillium digitatum Pd1]KAG0153360.1 hypothetical protein PDIDSM_5213 [Penicillium digitatum]QQK39555.1 Selenoprotein, Rdx type [Penicillium digitatum]